jgi:hypothetical protein
MKIKYTLKFKSICPSDKDVIEYKAIIHSNGRDFTLVEDMKKFVENFEKEEHFQEDITQLLADQFQGKVVTYGTHQGVKIKCVIK